jgi:hypothetical protein
VPTHLVVKTSNSWIIQTIHQTRVPIGKAGEWLNGPCLQGNSDGSTSPHARQCDVDLGTAVGFPASSSGTCGPATGRLDRAGSTLIKRCAWRRGQRRGDRQSTEFRRSGRWPRNHHLGLRGPIRCRWRRRGTSPARHLALSRQQRLRTGFCQLQNLAVPTSSMIHFLTRKRCESDSGAHDDGDSHRRSVLVTVTVTIQPTNSTT